jgi:hypothetical protein
LSCMLLPRIEAPLNAQSLMAGTTGGPGEPLKARVIPLG